MVSLVSRMLLVIFCIIVVASAADWVVGRGAAQQGRNAARATKIVVYSPFTVRGVLAAGIRIVRTGSGYCWSGSNLSGRPDAWRCFRGNLIEDPCFSGSRGSWVACPVGYPWQRQVLRLILTEPLPRRPGDSPPVDPTKGDPWAVQLTNGKRCRLISGATGAVAGLRINYGCTNGGSLVGSPRRRSSLWTIFYLGRVDSNRMTTVAISVAWW